MKTIFTPASAIFPTDNRFVGRFGMYMTFRRVIGTSGTLCLAPEIIRMGMVPFWVAIKVSPLAVWMVMGGGIVYSFEQ